MAERNIIVVAKSFWDNGYLDNAVSYYNEIHGSCIQARTVKEMVDAILKQLAPEDCIRQLLIVGHGNGGRITLGDGIQYTQFGDYIGHNNGTMWEQELARLKPHFCRSGHVILNACYTGAGSEGARLLKKVADLLGVPAQAPTAKKFYRCEFTLDSFPFRTYTYGYAENVQWQHAQPNQPQPPLLQYGF